MLPLSEFIALIQFELQKSFDFSEQLMFELSQGKSDVLQLAVDSFEIELPVHFSLESKTVEAVEPMGGGKPNVVLHQIDAPFLGKATLKALKTEVESKPADGQSLKGKRIAPQKPPAQVASQIMVAIGAVAVAGEPSEILKMGSIKLSLKPVLK